MNLAAARRVGAIALIGSFVAVVASTVPAATAPAALTMDRPAASCGCSWTVDQLPRSPDAVEGWYAGC